MYAIGVSLVAYRFEDMLNFDSQLICYRLYIHIAFQLSSQPNANRMGYTMLVLHGNLSNNVNCVVD